VKRDLEAQFGTLLLSVFAVGEKLLSVVRHHIFFCSFSFLVCKTVQGLCNIALAENNTVQIVSAKTGPYYY
jgi:hypothetical protein